MNRVRITLFLLVSSMLFGCTANSKEPPVNAQTKAFLSKPVKERTAFWKGTSIDKIINIMGITPTREVTVKLNNTFMYVFEEPYKKQKENCVIMALMDENKVVNEVMYSFCGERYEPVRQYFGYNEP